MAGLFSQPVFETFGPTELDPTLQLPALCRIAARRPSALRKAVQQECPRQPGVYGMVDGHGELIYVGKAKSLRARLMTYFRPRSRDPKAGRILKRTEAIVWEAGPSEFAALHRELELIRRWRPRFNVQGQPRGRRRTYLCLGRPPAPYAFLSRRPAANVLARFGPIPGGRRASEAVRRLNDWFRLRDCAQAQTMVFADQSDLFPVLRAAGCLRFEIGTCLGPCIGSCSRSGYRERVAAARSFLAGTDAGPLEALEQDMKAASAELAFEKAAALRDKLDALGWLHQHLERLRLARQQLSFVYPVAGINGKDLWYLIHAGRTVAVAVRPHNPETARAAMDAVQTVFRRSSGHHDVLPAAEVDGLLLVSSWFRRYPEEQARTLKPAEALAGCRKSLH